VEGTAQFLPFPLGLFRTLVGAVHIGYGCETLLLLLAIMWRLGTVLTQTGASEQFWLDAGIASVSALADFSASVSLN